MVVLKAMLVALLAGVMFLAARPDRTERIEPGRKANPTGWFAAIAVGLALVACAPRLLLQPVIVSMLCTAMTFWLLNSRRNTTKIWQLPVCLGALFLLWVNMDGWFILGPILVALFLVGEFLERLLSAAEIGRAHV